MKTQTKLKSSSVGARFCVEFLRNLETHLHIRLLIMLIFKIVSDNDRCLSNWNRLNIFKRTQVDDDDLSDDSGFVNFCEILRHSI